MELNIPVAIEQVSNGYVIRPLTQAGKSDLFRDDAVIAPTLRDLLRTLADHFRFACCPQCDRPAGRQYRSSVSSIARNQRVMVCLDCHLIAPEGWAGDWLQLPAFTERQITPEEWDKLETRLQAMYEEQFRMGSKAQQ